MGNSPNRNKQIGTRAERRVRKYFNDNGLRCERRALAGSKDEGDLRVTLPNGSELTVEVKTGKQTWNYTRGQLDEWKRQTMVEADNSGCPGILVLVRYKRLFVNSEVWIPSNDPKAWTMTYIDDFVRRMGAR